MICKQNVVIDTLSKEMLWAAMVMDTMHEIKTGREMQVCSVNDGLHEPGSKHYTGDAMDVKTYFLGGDEERKAFASDLIEALGPTYKIILARDYLHIEYCSPCNSDSNAQNRC